MRRLSTADRAIFTSGSGRLAASVTGRAVSLAVSSGDPAQFFRAYLPAYLFFLGLTLGSMVLLMIYHLTGGAWGFLVRRMVEACTERCR